MGDKNPKKAKKKKKEGVKSIITEALSPEPKAELKAKKRK